MNNLNDSCKQPLYIRNLKRKTPMSKIQLSCQSRIVCLDVPYSSLLHSIPSIPVSYTYTQNRPTPPPSSTYRSPKHPLISNKLPREPLNTLPLFPPSPLPLRCNPFLLSKKSYLRSTYTTLCSQNRPTYLKLCIVHLNLIRLKGSYM